MTQAAATYITKSRRSGPTRPDVIERARDPVETAALLSAYRERRLAMGSDGIPQMRIDLAEFGAEKLADLTVDQLQTILAHP